MQVQSTPFPATWKKLFSRNITWTDDQTNMSAVSFGSRRLLECFPRSSLIQWVTPYQNATPYLWDRCRPVRPTLERRELGTRFCMEPGRLFGIESRTYWSRFLESLYVCALPGCFWPTSVWRCLDVSSSSSFSVHVGWLLSDFLKGVWKSGCWRNFLSISISSQRALIRSTMVPENLQGPTICSFGWRTPKSIAFLISKHFVCRPILCSMESLRMTSPGLEYALSCARRPQSGIFEPIRIHCRRSCFCEHACLVRWFGSLGEERGFVRYSLSEHLMLFSWSRTWFEVSLARFLFLL